VLADLPGEGLTVSWRRESTPMLTKLGLASVDGDGIVMRIDLPYAEQRLFAPLARYARLLDATPDIAQDIG
jgi:hypothetical protein